MHRPLERMKPTDSFRREIGDRSGDPQEGARLDAIARRPNREPVPFSRTEVRRILGQEMDEAEIERILRRLGFGVTPGRARTAVANPTPPLGIGGTRVAVAERVADFTVDIPTWRLDIERARVERIGSSLP